MSHRSSQCAICPFARHPKPRSLDGQPRLFESAATYDALPSPQTQRLREAIAPYLCLDDLRRLAASSENLQDALRSAEPVPDEVQALLSLFAELLTPGPNEVLRTPAEFAALLLPQMGALDHEEFWVICLDTRFHVQRIVPLYRGTANSSVLRTSEVFRPAIALSSTAIVVAHNHPGHSTCASSEDVQATIALREAGRMLDIELLDHLIIAQGQWSSMREQRQGW